MTIFNKLKKGFMRTKFYSLFILAISFRNSVWAQGDEQLPPPPDQSLWQTFVMIGVALAFFYLILWRPEQKRRKAMDEQRDTLKKGDKVIAMGIIGTVVRVGEQTVILKMYDGAKIEFFKSAITDVLSDTEGSKKVDLISEESEK
jgi:preprotein translocase subunit YajC